MLTTGYWTGAGRFVFEDNRVAVYGGVALTDDIEPEVPEVKTDPIPEADADDDGTTTDEENE